MHVDAEDAASIVQELVSYDMEQSSDAERVTHEALAILKDADAIKTVIESNPGHAPVRDALMWATAKHVGFDQQKFSQMYPGLFGYGHVLLVSKELVGSPRVIYQVDWGQGMTPRMLFGKGSLPLLAPIVSVGPWNDPEKITDWFGEYSFKNTDRGPYLLSTSIGRETTGAKSIRHILYWIRIEATRLVPERFEAYDVPIGQNRKAEYLKITALPVNDLESPQPSGRTSPTLPRESKGTSKNSIEKDGLGHAKSLPSAGNLALKNPSVQAPVERSWWIVGVSVAVGCVLLLGGWFLLRRRL